MRQFYFSEKKSLWKQFTNILKFAVASWPLCMIPFSVLHLQIHKFWQNKKMPQFCFNLHVSIQSERLCVNLSYCSILTCLFVVQLIFFFPHKLRDFKIRVIGPRFPRSDVFVLQQHENLSIGGKKTEGENFSIISRLCVVQLHFFHK